MPDQSAIFRSAPDRCLFSRSLADRTEAVLVYEKMLEHDWRSGRFFFPSYLKEAPVLVARARSEFRQLPENRYRNIGLAATE